MSKLKLTTLATQDDSASVPADTIVNGTAKAWVNFNGTGTVAIRRAFNVSSITDNGMGDYTVNFATAMVDANYSVTGSTSYGSVVASGRIFGTYPISTAYQTGSIRIATTYAVNAFEDEAVVNVTIFS